MKTNLWKKIAALVLTLCMVLTILPAMPLTANAAEYTEGYNGTPVTPGKISASNYRSFGLTDENWSQFNGYYGIRTASELYGFADVVNNGNRTASALLLKDIVINTGKVTESGSSSGTTYEWIPIGVNRDVSFLGNFEGNGHTISGLYFNELERECVGLFGLIGEAVQNNSVKIQNVTLANSFIRSSEKIGGIVGAVLGYGSTISGCKIAEDVTIQGRSSTGYPNLGGILGEFAGLSANFGSRFRVSCTIQHCVNLGKMITELSFSASVNINGKNYFGAIAGAHRLDGNAYEFVVVEDCYYVSGNMSDLSGETFNIGSGGTNLDRSDKGSTVLSSANAPHSCLIASYPEIAATCQHTGRSAYSSCLVCGQLTAGSKTELPVVDHAYTIANCTTPATCVFCGITVGVVDGENHTGSIARYVSADNTSHYGVYSCCGAYTANEQHSLSDATCVAAQICSVCGNTQGSKDPSNHTKDEKIYTINVSDRTKHDYKWKCCGLLISTDAHTLDSNAKCTACGYECEHLKTSNGVCTLCGKSGIGYINRYWDSVNNVVVSNNALASSATTITASTNSMTEGWYVLENDVTITGRVTVSGTVNIILEDGYTLNLPAGIEVNGGATLNIYGQVLGTGALIAAVSDDVNYGNDAAIGGKANSASGTVNIHGGTVTATANRGAAIGSGWSGSGGAVMINGGTVFATGEGSGPAIGAGSDARSRGTVMINGGTVSAVNTYNSFYTWSAAIGGGYRANASNVVINGGNVKAYAPRGDAIGTGLSGSAGTLKNAAGSDLSLYTITLSGATADTKVAEVNGLTYGLTDVKTLDTDKLYFYLPADSAAKSVKAEETDYFCSADSKTFYSAHNWENSSCTRCGEICNHNGQKEICGICGTILHIHRWEYSVSMEKTSIVAACVAEGCDIVHGGSVTIVLPADVIYNCESKDASLVFENWQFGEEAKPVLRYNDVDRVNVTGEDIETYIELGGVKAQAFYKVAPISLADAVVSVNDGIYTGEALTPEVAVQLNGKALTKDAEYVVSYSDNVDVGTAVVTVTGIGNYTGEITKTFSIVCIHTGGTPTCSAQAICELCKQPYGELAPDNHSYEGVVTDPTCTEEGYTTYTCAACGDSYVDDEVAALGHSYEGVVTDPTCTEEGYTTYTCAACGDSYVTDIVSPTGHSYDAGVLANAPTCTEIGVMIYTCTICGNAKSVILPANGHTHGEPMEIIVFAPTCTNAGMKQVLVHCTVCGLGVVNDVEKLPALEHSNDFNGDGKLDNNDVIELLWYTLYPAYNTENRCVDVNHNGKSNNDDVLALLWHILFPEEHPL